MITLEVIATSVQDCVVAEANGAQRIELCMALELGGLTPSLGLMLEARQATRLPILAIVRPRPGGFVYDDVECATMVHDARLLLDAGADGIVFGALTRDGAIDRARCASLLAVAAGRPVTFHRAFDFTTDPAASLDLLVSLGVTRILTSGHAPSAEAGMEQIARLVRRARGHIYIMPGGGVCEANVAEIVGTTGCTEVHASLSARSDPLYTPGGVRLEGGAGIDGSHRLLDGDRVRRMRDLLGEIESP